MLKENLVGLQTLVSIFDIASEKKDKIVKYVELIEEWNEKTNLVSSSDVSKIAGKHIIESMLFNENELLKDECHIVDLGSGAGFPGIPLKIVNPSIFLTLVESRKMKALFLEEAVRALGLSRTSVLCERIENTTEDKFEHSVDIVTARAVANMKKLWSWTRNLFNKGGLLLVVKGGNFEAEIDEAREAYDDFDVRVKNTEYISPTNNNLFQIMFIKK